MFFAFPLFCIFSSRLHPEHVIRAKNSYYFTSILQKLEKEFVLDFVLMF